MYKSRLQELCQQQRLPMAKYDTEKTGLNHAPRFRASVTVNGLSFTSPRECSSAKEAQNEAAKAAILHFATTSNATTAAPPVVASSASSSSSSSAATGSDPLPRMPSPPGIELECLTVFAIDKSGSFHALRYKAKLAVGSQTFESPQSFNMLKEAENATARVAMMSLSEDGDEDAISIYKNLLLELVQKEGLSAPVYETSVDGPSHLPVFLSTVIIEGEKFKGAAAKTKKQAEQKAAKVAWCALKEHCRVGTSRDCTNMETSSNVSLTVSHCGQHKAAAGCVDDSGSQLNDSIDMEESLEDGFRLTPMQLNSYANFNAIGLAGVGSSSKNQLQIYAQKRNLNLPAYECVREGSFHSSRYKAKVTVAGQTFESPQSFSLLKEAENAAARVALMSLLEDGDHEDSIPLYKNYLLELAQKDGLPTPVYKTSMGGPSHIPVFRSTVQIEGETFSGTAAKTKKLAEQNAAKIAWSVLKERKSSRHATLIPSFDVHQNIEIASSGAKFAATDVSLVPELSQPEASSGSTSYIQPADCRDGFSEECTPMKTSSNIHSMVSDRTQQETAKSLIIESASQADNVPAVETKESVGDRSSTRLVKLETHANADATGKILNSLPHCRVQVYPSSTNFILPEGGSLLPFSDDKWVAVSFDSGKN